MVNLLTRNDDHIPTLVNCNTYFQKNIYFTIVSNNIQVITELCAFRLELYINSRLFPIGVDRI